MPFSSSSWRGGATLSSRLPPPNKPKAQLLHPLPVPKKRWEWDGSPSESRLGLVTTKTQDQQNIAQAPTADASIQTTAPPLFHRLPFRLLHAPSPCLRGSSSGLRYRERTIRRLLEVYVGIAQRSARGNVPTDSDGHDGPSRRELLVEHGFGHIWVEVSHVERGQRIARAASVHGQPQSSAAEEDRPEASGQRFRTHGPTLGLAPPQQW